MEGSLVAYKVFTNGSVLNASEINDNLMNQSVMVFSNAAARTAAITSPIEGMLTWLEDTNTYEYRDGSGAWVGLIPGAWTSYTPTLGWNNGTGGSVTARYAKFGRTVHGSVLAILGTGFSFGSLTVSLPFAKQASTSPVNASWTLDDFGAGETLGINRGTFDNTVAAYVPIASTPYITPANPTSTIPFPWAAGDRIIVAFTYESAS